MGSARQTISDKNKKYSDKQRLDAWTRIIDKAKEVNELAKKRGLTIRFTEQVK